HRDYNQRKAFFRMSRLARWQDQWTAIINLIRRLGAASGDAFSFSHPSIFQIQRLELPRSHITSTADLKKQPLQICETKHTDPVSPSVLSQSLCFTAAIGLRPYAAFATSSNPNDFARFFRFATTRSRSLSS